MVRSLGDESQHDGIGRWFDDDEETVQSPQQVHTEEEQKAQKQPLDVNSPKEIIEWVNIRNQVAEWRLLNAVIDVPTQSSVPSLNRTEETMSFSTRSVHEATESGPRTEMGTLHISNSEMELIRSRLAQTFQGSSDSSSHVSWTSSPALSNYPTPGTAATSPPTHEYEPDESVASMDDYPESNFQYPMTSYPLVESPSPYEPDQQTSDSERGSPAYEEQYDNDESSQNNTRREERPPSEISTGCGTTESTGVLQYKDQPNKRGAEDDGNEHRITAGSKRSKSHEGSNLRLACPFYKFDPIRHRRCHAIRMTRISYVKQHLFRSHMQPIHCDICLSIWPNEEDLREHRRAQQCVKRAYIAPKGITPDQKRKLQSRLGSKNKSESDQWFELYSILFPNSKKPKSAYLDGELSEDVESLREFMERRGADIMMNQLVDSSVFQQAGVDSHELQQHVQNALTSMFDGWHNQRKEMGGETSDGRSKRLKSTHREFLAMEDQGCRRTDTASTGTSRTMELEDQVDEQTSPATSTT
ncbi:Ff.00g003620.m01.CDS01 [Fusarium sp. VM40]|nr:Ff.00g003620.m01.CDS01 [Fusarium sp. VM40]